MNIHHAEDTLTKNGILEAFMHACEPIKQTMQMPCALSLSHYVVLLMVACMVACCYTCKYMKMSGSPHHEQRVVRPL